MTSLRFAVCENDQFHRACALRSAARPSGRQLFFPEVIRSTENRASDLIRTSDTFGKNLHIVIVRVRLQRTEREANKPVQRTTLAPSASHIAQRPGQYASFMFEQSFVKLVCGLVPRQPAPVVKAPIARKEFESQFLQPGPVAFSLRREKLCDRLPRLANPGRFEKPGNIQLGRARNTAHAE